MHMARVPWGRRLMAFTVFASAYIGVVPAKAQSTGFALNRFDPSERGSDWFWAESLDLRGHNRWAIGVVGDWAYKPLVAYDENGDEVASLVENQVYAHVGASWILWDRLRLGLSAPVLVYQNGESLDAAGQAFDAPSGAAFGDVRLGGDVRLFGEYGDFITGAVGAHVHLPTGSSDSFTGDGKARFVPRATLAGDLGVFTYAVKTGVNLRFEGEDFAGEAMGHEWTFGLAGGLRLLDKRLTIGPEVWAATVVTDGGDGFFQRGSTPVEGVFGAHYKFAKMWKIGAGVGPGFTQGLGSPEVRTLASLEWFPDPKEQLSAPPADTDSDGIYDREDACPTHPGVANDDPEKHGCPAPPDTDGDGIIDPVDACVDEPGPESEDPDKHGCPLPKDRDSDGILDTDDACPDEPGAINQDPSKNGCPVRDSDGDGILDPDDACPETPGVESPDPKKHGCPKAKIKDGKVVIMDRIEFDTGKASIRDMSLPVLQAVLKILNEHPEIKQLRVEGHTDNKGAPWYNKNLSQKRAQEVVKWLLEQGVEAERLTSLGKGQEAPIDSNETEEGRQNNRRVEFHIVEEKGAAK